MDKTQALKSFGNRRREKILINLHFCVRIHKTGYQKIFIVIKNAILGVLNKRDKKKTPVVSHDNL